MLIDDQSHRVEIDPELLLTALSSYVEMVAGESRVVAHLRVDAHDLQVIFECLASSESVDQTKLAQLEFQYLDVLGRGASRPRTLHRALATEPTFLVDLLKLLYREEGDVPRTRPDERQRALAQQAYKLLHSWKELPGRDENGSIDAKALEQWILGVRAGCAAAGRVRIGDNQIGTALAASPAGGDGHWPHEAVRDVIESYGTSEILEGFRVAVRNARGAVTKSAGEGGEQERSLAKKYRTYANAVANDWPTTASVLRRIADDYDREGSLEDVEGRLNR